MLIPEKVTVVLLVWTSLALVGTWMWMYLDSKEREETE